MSNRSNSVVENKDHSRVDDGPPDATGAKPNLRTHYESRGVSPVRVRWTTKSKPNTVLACNCLRSKNIRDESCYSAEKWTELANGDSEPTNLRLAATAVT
jgi:hypothetical protein